MTIVLSVFQYISLKNPLIRFFPPIVLSTETTLQSNSIRLHLPFSLCLNGSYRVPRLLLSGTVDSKVSLGTGITSEAGNSRVED